MAQDGGLGLPIQHKPHDALRQGLAALKDDAELSHPVEAIQANVTSQESVSKQIPSLLLLRLLSQIFAL